MEGVDNGTSKPSTSPVYWELISLGRALAAAVSAAVAAVSASAGRTGHTGTGLAAAALTTRTLAASAVIATSTFLHKKEGRRNLHELSKTAGYPCTMTIPRHMPLSLNMTYSPPQFLYYLTSAGRSALAAGATAAALPTSGAAASLLAVAISHGFDRRQGFQRRKEIYLSEENQLGKHK